MLIQFTGGTTFHSGLAFKFGSKALDFTSEKLEVTRKFLQDVEVVIVDEMSLVSADNLYNLHKRLQSIFLSDDLFGGRCLMLVGDILQLPPVKATPIYKYPTDFSSYVMYRSKDLNLWENCESVLLETNFRHGEGEWTKMLNRIRIGEATEEDITKLKNRPATLLSETEYNEAIHVCYTNLEVNNHNEIMLNHLDGDIIEITANCKTPKGYKAKTGKYGQVDGTQFAMRLKLKNRARVMIISNIDIKGSMVNGSLGTVIDFIKTETGMNLYY